MKRPADAFRGLPFVSTWETDGRRYWRFRKGGKTVRKIRTSLCKSTQIALCSLLKLTRTGRELFVNLAMGGSDGSLR